MSLGEIAAVTSGVSSLLSLLRSGTDGDGPPGIFDDGVVEQNEFDALIRRAITDLTGESGEDTPEADRMAASLSPLLFRALDQDQSGAIEGDETDRLQSILSRFNPALLRMTMVDPGDPEDPDNPDPPDPPPDIISGNK